jgi:hypothetical protein
MTNEDIEMCKEKIHKGMQMVLEKAEHIGRTESMWSMEELGEMADITKDMSEALKNIAKTHYYLSEHSIKRY